MTEYTLKKTAQKDLPADALSGNVLIFGCLRHADFFAKIFARAKSVTFHESSDVTENLFSKASFDTLVIAEDLFLQAQNVFATIANKYMLLLADRKKIKKTAGFSLKKSGGFTPSRTSRFSWALFQKDESLKALKRENISLIVYDFDGVMTDNRVIVDQDGKEAVTANRGDGLGIDYLRKLNIPQLILSTETNPVVKARAAKLKMEIISSCGNKKKALQEYCRKKGFSMRKTIFVGNDMNDMEVMKTAGFSVAPSDAHTEILATASLVTSAKGGFGVIRELADIIIKVNKISNIHI